jgi:hypothetical protein
MMWRAARLPVFFGPQSPLNPVAHRSHHTSNESYIHLHTIRHLNPLLISLRLRAYHPRQSVSSGLHPAHPPMALTTQKLQGALYQRPGTCIAPRPVVYARCNSGLGGLLRHRPAAASPTSSSSRRRSRKPARSVTFEQDASSHPSAAAAAAAAPRTSPCAAAARPLSHSQLLDVANRFVSHWFAGISKGPNDAVVRQLTGLVHDDVTIEADGVRRLERSQVRADPGFLSSVSNGPASPLQPP